MAVAQKGAISFGLVYIPVELYTATEDNDIRFNQLSKKNMSRIRYLKTDDDGSPVTNDDIVKGFQYEKDQYVVVTDEDFEKIKTDKDRSIQILLFHDQCALSPAYYNRSYYVLPQKGGEKAFNLLRAAMMKTAKIAIGRTVMGTKETLLMLMAADDAILLVTLFYEEEIKALPKSPPQPHIEEAEMDMAVRLVDSMARAFNPADYKDEYQEKLRKLIEAKVAGKEIEAPAERTSSKVINLMEALKASLEQAAPQPGPKRKTRKKAV